MADDEVKVCDTGDIDICASNKQEICFFCHCKFSKYTCPRCTASYCSISCYKSEKHMQCSEDFYRKNVMEEISNRVKDPEDVQNVLRMLENVERQDQGLEEEYDAPPLEDRFANINLSTADVDDIWNALTPDERREFETSVQAGSLSHLIEQWTPWWEHNNQRSVSNSIQVIKSGDGQHNYYSSMEENSNLKQSPKCPKVLETIPACNVSVNPLVKYSLVDVLYAYAYVMRMFNGAPEENLNQSVMILYKLASTLSKNQSFESVEAVVHNSLNAVTECADTSNSQEFSHNILLDVCDLLSGCHSVGEQNTAFIDSALSDVCRLMSKYKKALKSEMGSKNEDAKKIFLAKKKVEFFVSWNQSNKSSLCSLVGELKALHFNLISSWKIHNTETKKMEKRLKGKNVSNKNLIEEL